MERAILKSISAENFASFAEKIVFSCIADESKKEHKMNTFKIGDNIINKVSYIYGANGSGKTFFCKVFREIQRMVVLSPLFMMKKLPIKDLFPSEDLLKPMPKFAFDIAYKDLPTTLGIDIIIDEITYHYEFSVFNQMVVYELLTKKYRRTEKILERTSPSFEDIILKSELKSFEDNKHVVKKEALCLAMAAMLNNDLADTIVNAIKEINVVNMTYPRLDPTEIEAFSEERIKKYVKVLKKADPTIREMHINYKEEEVARQKIESDDFENREIIQKKTTVGVKTEHALYDHGLEIESGTDQIEFFKDESLGTIKLFTALPYLFDILEKGGVLVLDEIENGLHLSLVKEIISLFINEKTNPHNAQLICTTHQPLLVSNDVKKDQVWVISKDKFGKSFLKRLSDKNFSRAKVNLTNKILEGALGCNPEKFF
ncbi:AAA family ATPase [Megamonas rupellensis]|uniref:AAA family ATPase n=1 Tax=Megamonas rupellensis TaxID=491921 RepID=UPI000361D5AF|nr:ATP-binding protein [Megamonas rupellensis]